MTNFVTVNDGLGPVDLDISATITSGGFGGIQKEGPGTLQLSGSSSNTYSGTTFVNAGTLVLNKSPGADAIPGTFVIGLFSGVQTVLLLAPDQIADTAQVQVFPSGGFGLNGFDDTIGSLQLRSGAGTASAVATGAGTLSLAGDLTLIANNGGDTGATIFGNLNLLPGPHSVQYRRRHGGERSRYLRRRQRRGRPRQRPAQEPSSSADRAPTPILARRS